jgi:leucine dehydrogenase
MRSRERAVITQSLVRGTHLALRKSRKASQTVNPGHPTNLPRSTLSESSFPVGDYLHRYDFENVVFCNDNTTGLRAVIAIHDTTLGPAAGGCRMRTYPTEWEAVEDALRLGRGMTYKYAAAGVDLGGGKAVVIGDPRRDKSEALFRSLGRFIERLGGTYYTGEDVGTTLTDMENMFRETRFVITLPQYLGGAGPIGGATALGVVLGMRVAVRRATGSDSLEGLTVGVQGLGAVGSELVPQLARLGAKLTVCDPEAERVSAIQRGYDVRVVPPEEIYRSPMDVFAPCALGGILNSKSIPELSCKVIAGCANNQLRTEQDGIDLEKRGIVYAPDYIINAGGTVYDTDRLFGGSHVHDRAIAKVHRITETTARVFDIAEREGIPSYRAADQLAEARIADVAKAKTLRTRGDFR